MVDGSPSVAMRACVLAITSLPMFGRTNGSPSDASMWVSWVAWGVLIGPSNSESLSQDHGNGRRRRRRDGDFWWLACCPIVCWAWIQRLTNPHASQSITTVPAKPLPDTASNHPGSHFQIFVPCPKFQDMRSECLPKLAGQTPLPKWIGQNWTGQSGPLPKG